MSTIDLITAGNRASGPIHATAEDATALFDALDSCAADMLSGLWAGREIYTGHPLDGSLANVSWYGKRFDGRNEVHPLVVADRAGVPYPLNPEVVPMLIITNPISTPSWVKAVAPKLMTALRPVAQARTYGAHITMVEHRGVTTAAMSYNTRPIVDTFRAVDENTIVGMMEYPKMPRPHFFVLQRVNSGDNNVR